MVIRRTLIVGIVLISSARSRADMPYPSDPQPCSALTEPTTCTPATEFSRYLFLPTTTPPTLPNDFGSDNWKLTSTTTGDPQIDTNPQELFGVKGASVDLAWQVTTGRPDVLIAVLDSGIEWQNNLPDVVNKIYLNRGELPPPEDSSNAADPWDRNGDGVFNIRDYLADDTHAQDSRVGDRNGNGVIDPEDLIFIFSNGVDEDHNGYVDDIAGWDFFEDDNDPLDEVGYGHGTGEAHDSNAEANNGGGEPGTCPSCMVMPVRVGDSFVAEVNNFAQGVLFATDSGARVIQEALGTLNNSSLAQAAVDYAYHRGVIVVASAADEESNHHNYPANYNHTLEVNSVTKFADFAGRAQTPPSYLYLNGCTNYGGHIAVAVPSSSCSSEATGKSAGMAGLVYAAALNEIDRGHLTPYPRGDGSTAAFPLSANEVKQLLTLTADDINFDARPDAQPPLPQNYAMGPMPGIQMSERFHSIAGWDQYFGYGRINANSAVRRVQAGMIPPEAEIDSPVWFAMIDSASGALQVNGRVAANRAASYAYTVEVAPGIQPAEGDFVAVGGQTGLTAAHEGTLATISLSELAARMPHGVEGPSVDAAGLPDPDRFSFTVRVQVVDSAAQRGEDRHSYFLHHDPDLTSGVSRQLPSDGAASPVLADLDGDGIDDVIVATSDGEVHAYHGRDGSELPGWPVHGKPLEVHDGTPAFHSGEVPAAPSAAMLGAPAVGDLDRNGQLEVVAADEQGYVYVWDHTGTLRPGFPVSTLASYSNSHRSERDLSTPNGQVPDRTNRHSRDNRLARAFGTAPALGNLDGSADGSLEIIVGAADRHVYAWHADGSPVAGWPLLLKDPTKVQAVDPVTNEVTLKSDAKADIGTKIITPVALGDIDGDGTLDVVVGVNEQYSERLNATIDDLILNFAQALGLLHGGNGRVYALFHDGTAHGSSPIDHGWNPDAFMPGWPAKIAILNLTLLPTVGTGINGAPVLADVDKDGQPEIGVFSFLGPAYVLNGQGGSFLGSARGLPRTLDISPLGTGSNSTTAPSVPGLGGGVLAEMDGPNGGFQFVAPTVGFGKFVDNELPGHQTPSDCQMGVWNIADAAGTSASGAFRPAFPRVVNDLQFLTSPSVGDIDGDGLPEAVVGSGVYDLHAFNINGVEPQGWPKLTGGWMIATPALGDIDGDGRLEVVSVTREGSLLAWKTAANECGSIPWRQFHHDAWHTGNYNTDARPPAPIVPASATLGQGTNGVVTLTLSAVPGDDLYCGAPAAIDVRYASHAITNESEFTAATRFTVLDVPAQSGRTQAATLRLQAPEHTTAPVYVAARTSDAAGNLSAITALGQTTLAVPTASPTATLTPTTLPTASPTATLTPTTLPTATVTATRTQAPAGDDGGGCAVDPRARGGVWHMAAMLASCLVLVARTRSRRRSSGGGTRHSVASSPGMKFPG